MARPASPAACRRTSAGRSDVVLRAGASRPDAGLMNVRHAATGRLAAVVDDSTDDSIDDLTAMPVRFDADN